MSVNNALENDEVNNHPSKINTNTPPIIEPFDGSDIPPENNWQLASGFQKKVETSNEDSVSHRTDHEIIFKAEDIKKKGKIEYFVNVKGAERRRREALRRSKAEAIEARKHAKKEDARVISELKAKANDRKKENLEAQKKQKAEDDRIIDELKKKATKRKKENRATKRQERRHKIRNFFSTILYKIVISINKVHHFLFCGWHKIVTITVIVVAILIPTGFLVYHTVNNHTATAETERQQKIKDLKEEIIKLANEDVEGSKDQILADAIELDNIEQSENSAITVMNWAMNYRETDLYNQYHQLCIDRGGCLVVEGGQG